MYKSEILKKNEDEERVFPLKQIYFYLTEGCNLACRHCWLSPKLQNKQNTYPALSIEHFKSVLEQAKLLNLSSVKLTGGEPLMHPEIIGILKILKEHSMHICIETNGVLCTKFIAEEVAGACKNPSVSVSLDGADAGTHELVRGIDGCFQHAVKGIQNFVAAGVKPQVIMTVMRHNKDQIKALVHLAESLDVESVKFNLVQPTGRGEKMDEMGDTLSLEELLDLGHWVVNTLSDSTKLQLYYDLPPAFIPMGKMFGVKGDGCATCKILEIIGVLPNGDYALCGIGSHIPELVFGQAGNHQLDTIWNTNRIILELREGIPHRFEGICGSCHMKRMCYATCIAQNYYRSKGLWKPYWFCDEAYRKGLFPKSRISPKPIN